MKEFVAVATLFVLGSVIGYFIEVLFRRIFTARKWVNPGFLQGPYLPLYGFGTIALYAIWSIDLSFINNQALVIVLKILFIGVFMTLIELIAGLIFIKGLKIKLWDYSNRFLNFKGLICPLFSFLWLVAGSAYYFLLHPYLIKAVLFLSENPIYDFFVGLILGAMLLDAIISLQVGIKIHKVLGNINIKFDELRSLAKNHVANSGLGKHLSTFALTISLQAGSFISFIKQRNGKTKGKSNDDADNKTSLDVSSNHDEKNR